MWQPDFRFEKGQWLRSRAVGEVVFVAPDVVVYGRTIIDEARRYVHLRDAQGRLWHRDKQDLSTCEADAS